MIQLKKIRKSFGEQVVLNGINFEIPQGKITVIMGRSGEGKSVLLKTIIGLLKPDQGEVWVDGVDTTHLSSFKKNEITKKFGMLFQGAALFDSMNVFDNVAFPLREHTSLDEKEINHKVTEILAQVGLKNIGHKIPSELSGGMRKRVGLARALILEPKIMLYDEPTTGLDPILSDSIDHLILDTQRRLNITSVMVSHDILGAFKVADKIAMLHEGKILEEGTPEEFRNSKIEFVQRFLEGKAEKSFIG